MTEGVREKKRRPWWLRLILWGAWLAAIGLLITLLMEFRGRRQWDRAVEDARAMGGPVTFAEVQAARPDWPDDANGARLVMQLYDRFESAVIADDEVVERLPVVGEGDLPPLGGKWSEEADVAVGKYLQAFSDDLAVLDRIVEFKGGRFPLDITGDPIHTLLPHVTYSRFGLKLKSLQVIHRAMRGSLSSTATDIATMIGLCRLLKDDPLLISAMARTGNDSQVLSTLERALSMTSPDADQLRSVEEQLAGEESEDRLYWAIRGERAYVIEVGECIREKGIDWITESGSEPEPAPWFIMPGVRGRAMGDLSELIRMQSRLIQASDRNEQIAVAEELEKEAERMPHPRLAQALMPSFRRCMLRDIELTAELRSARTALAAERYRLDKGQFPTRLDDLVPDYVKAVPVDPFDDKPLKYWVADREVVVYSVGKNLADDSGDVEALVPPGSEAGDCGFALLRPEFRGRPADNAVPATQGVEAGETPTRPVN